MYIKIAVVFLFHSNFYICLLVLVFRTRNQLVLPSVPEIPEAAAEQILILMSVEHTCLKMVYAGCNFHSIVIMP